jgi:hypothetical protein
MSLFWLSWKCLLEWFLFFAFNPELGLLPAPTECVPLIGWFFLVEILLSKFGPEMLWQCQLSFCVSCHCIRWNPISNHSDNIVGCRMMIWHRVSPNIYRINTSSKWNAITFFDVLRGWHDSWYSRMVKQTQSWAVPQWLMVLIHPKNWWSCKIKCSHHPRSPICKAMMCNQRSIEGTTPEMSSLNLAEAVPTICDPP